MLIQLLYTDITCIFLRLAPIFRIATKGVAAEEITAINKLFGGENLLNGTPETVLATASRYEGFYRKAAAVIRGIAHGHLYNNGNKRTANAIFDLLVQRNGITTGVNAEKVQQIINQVATGELTSIDEIATALRGF